MTAGIRNTRFQARIEVERAFLTPVNSAFGTNSQLAGMTEKAILSWSAKASEIYPQKKISEISQILLNASKRAELLADDSRETFEPNNHKASGIDQLKLMLENCILDIRSSIDVEISSDKIAVI